MERKNHAWNQWATGQHKCQALHCPRNRGNSILEFTHICARRRKDGGFIVWRKTIAKRLRMKVKEVTKELKHRRHDPVSQEGRWVRSVVRGYFSYHAVPGNICALGRFREAGSPCMVAGTATTKPERPKTHLDTAAEASRYVATAAADSALLSPQSTSPRY